jgi:hypothetical protein
MPTALRGQGARVLAATLAVTAVLPGGADVGWNMDVIAPLRSVARVQLAVASGVPDDFQVEYGSGGGFTGMTQGVRIAADGSVVRWRRGPTGGGAAEQPVGSVDRSTVQALAGLLRSTGFFDLSSDQSGNVTVTLAATLGGRRHQVRYPQGAGQPPGSIAPLIEAIDRAVDEAGRKRP